MAVLNGFSLNPKYPLPPVATTFSFKFIISYRYILHKGFKSVFCDSLAVLQRKNKVQILKEGEKSSKQILGDTFEIKKWIGNSNPLFENVVGIVNEIQPTPLQPSVGRSFASCPRVV